MLIKLDYFDGNDGLLTFFKQYNKAGEVISGTDSNKRKLLSIFRNGTASVFLENLEEKNNQLYMGSFEKLV